jgi:hypothetical protein
MKYDRALSDESVAGVLADDSGFCFMIWKGEVYDILVTCTIIWGRNK